MLRKRKEPKAKKSMVEALMRDMQGSATQKLALFEKLKARGGFAGEGASVDGRLTLFKKVHRAIATASIGSGGFGITYEAHDANLGSTFTRL